jgi:serine/threonine-protein kinase
MRADLLPAIGGHRVERELGAGGMGQVFLCRDEALDRLVAVKVLLPELFEQEDMRARFLREARALAKVSSPHVVAVHAVGEDAVVGPFVVMEYLDGEDLHQRLVRDKRIPWRDAVRITRDAIQGLVAAEAAGIVHRDIKPANLFDVGGKAKLTDFGLAREVKGAATVTQAGIVVGTPAYLGPEVIRGNPATHQSDLYSLCATLHHLIAGEPPFTAEAPLECLAQACMEKPKPLRAILEGKGVPSSDHPPEALERVVLKGLEKKPEDRQQGWAALDAALASVTSSPPASASANSLVSAMDAPALPAASISDVPTMQVPMHAPPAEVSTSGTMAPALRIKTSTLTVMMTDIAGYTERTSRVSREESARWLSLHDSLLQPVFRSYGGKVVKTLGDAFLVTFPSPTDAVLCACAVQDRLWHHNRNLPTPNDAIHVRIALSAGEVRLHKGDIFGEPVNLAARLEGMAQPGEVLITDAVYATMNNSEVRLVSRGEHSFKGIARPVTVWAAQPDLVEGAAPFGERALARVSASPLDALRAGAPVAFEKARQMAERVAGVTKGMPRPDVSDAKRYIPMAAAFAIVLVVGLAIAALAGDDRLQRIDEGDAKAVVDEIEKIPEGERNAEDLAILGHARWKLDQRKRALDLWKRAAEKGYTDERMELALYPLLAERDDDDAAAVLIAWPNGSVNGELKSMLNGEDFWSRQNALEILDARKQADDDMRVRVAMKNIESDKCNERRVGVQLLKKYGKGEEALSTLKKLGQNGFANACFIFELGSAEREVKKRSE